MCATSREIELSVKPIIFLLQIYFGGNRRESDKAIKFLFMEQENCDYDIAVGKALHKDKALNTVYFEKIE